MLPRNHPDRIHVAFDDHRLVANAGLILPATLARHLGLPQLVQQRLDLGDAPGRANTGDKIVILVAAALALTTPMCCWCAKSTAVRRSVTATCLHPPFGSQI